MMGMETILREKRRALGLTQEQVASALGVTAPAVNKWEKGATCPDITLLPALARLLKTDPNTLLCFQETLSRQEIARILRDIAQSVREDGVERGFALAEEQTQAYPYCMELLHSAAAILDGALMMSALSEAQKEPYLRKVIALYERVAANGDAALADKANYMLASGQIRNGQYEKAQETLDSLPEWSALDKRGMQAEILSKRGEPAKAAQLLERKLMLSLQDQQATLCRLIQLAVQEDAQEAALALAECARRECGNYGMGEYWAHIGPLEAAVAREDADGATEALAVILREAAKPWSHPFSPLLRHLSEPKPSSPVPFPMLAPLLANLEDDPQYAFLQGSPAFQALVQSYDNAVQAGSKPEALR